jgi:hypothetical protein
VKGAAAAAAMAIACAIAITGCGLGAGPGTRSVSLTVTQDFGDRSVGSLSMSRVPGSETVMRFLQRGFRVSTSYGGGYVDSINGRSRAGAKTDWFYYVNGVQAPKGAATTAVHAGDRIWWDLHNWSATDSIPAVVGSFPEPFVHGIAGKRYPVTVECASDLTAACTRVSDDLAHDHVPAADQLLGTGSGADTLGLVVGTWSEIRGEVASELISYGPGASGVYAKFADGGSRLELLDPAGRVARVLGAGSGLIAATADTSGVPTWLITGTDPAGVAAAARQLTPQALHDHFALAVTGTATIPVPVGASG